jgi:hypothetical protein
MQRPHWLTRPPVAVGYNPTAGRIATGSIRFPFSSAGRLASGRGDSLGCTPCPGYLIIFHRFSSPAHLFTGRKIRVDTQGALKLLRDDNCASVVNHPGPK